MSPKILLCKRTAFGLLCVLAVVMAAATFIEHSRGTDFAARHIYYSFWFALLWAVMAVCGLVWLWAARPLRGAAQWRRNLHVWMLHGSLALILLGAAVSALTSWSGRVALRTGAGTDTYFSEEEGNPEKKLPFTMKLEGFEVATHSGTQTARDYISRIQIEGKTYVVSMNRVPTVRGVRIYQADYNRAGYDSIFIVRCDPWGQPVTYVGYACLLLSLLVLLFSKESGLHRAWGDLKKYSVVLLFFFPVLGIYAQNGEQPRALPQDVAGDFGRLYVSYGGRICPMQTMAQDFCRKVYGSPSWHGYSAEQVVTGWLFWPDDWNCAPIIEVKSRALRSELDLPRKATFNDFFLSGYRLGPLLGAEGGLQRAAAEVDDRIMLIYSLRRGELFTLFPVQGVHGKVVWITPTDAGGSLKYAPAADRLFIGNIFPKLFQDALAGNYGKVAQGIRTIASYQQKHGGSTLPSVQIVRAERVYNSFDLPTWLYRINLTLGLVMFLLTLKPRQDGAVSPSVRGGLRWGGGALLLLSFLSLTSYVALRSYVSGRPPLGNGFETMLTVAWFVMAVGFFLWRKGCTMPVLYSMPFIASGFFLLVASLSHNGAEISQLMPVLSSPLLSLHVSIIMLSYALLSFTFLISLAALLRTWLGRGRGDAALSREQECARLQSLVILYPAVVLLAVGIFLGAVWANVSWGRYWGWDSKEVWALITLIVYVLPLHTQSLSRLRRPRNYHLYLALAFATVLMTYFGVNFFLTGLHSYA